MRGGVGWQGGDTATLLPTLWAHFGSLRRTHLRPTLVTLLSYFVCTFVHTFVTFVVHFPEINIDSIPHTPRNFQILLQICTILELIGSYCHLLGALVSQVLANEVLKPEHNGETVGTLKRGCASKIFSFFRTPDPRPQTPNPFSDATVSEQFGCVYGIIKKCEHRTCLSCENA